MDPWYLDCTALNSSPSMVDAIERRFVHPVREQTIATAVALLAHQSSVMLTPDQAQQFIGGGLGGTNLRHPFLVRGVYLNWESGAYSVYRIGNAIYVRHGSLGHKAVPMKKWPIVVELEQAPFEVYVTCSMSE